jgi:LmbE family N-acetylglucosaminyl deacetylase
MKWVFLSPHFDDVALSCGGLVWEQAQAGNPVSIWTICADEIPDNELSSFAAELHARWGVGLNAPAQRKLEHRRSCQQLGASYRYFSVTDCIYRRDSQTQEFMYTSEAALNGELQPGDYQIIRTINEDMKNYLQPEAILVCPLGLGNHVDHQLTRMAAEGMGYPLWYYADFPYILKHHDQLEQLAASGWTSQVYPISRQGLEAWIASVAMHASQISTFWPSMEEMARSLSPYLEREGGTRLWQKSDLGL